MPITDTAKSYADTIRDAVGALSGFDREVALTTGHLTGLDVKLAAANRELNDLVFTSKRTVFGAMFKGFPESVYASRKAVADFGAEVERAAAVAKVFEVRAALAFKTPLKDFETLGKAAEKLNETLQGKLLAGFNSMKTVLVSGGGSMKHMRDALVEYNRSVYDASRLSEILGRSGVFKPQLWTTITKNTNLSKQSFADLYRELMIVNKGVTMTSTEFANLTQVMTKQFGGGVKQIAEQMQIFRQLQEDIPDLWDVIKRMRSDLAAGVDPKGMREMLLLTNQFKGNRGSDFFALMTTRVGAQNAELTRLESSMAKYQRTLDNLSVNTGQSAEQSLIFIADALSGVTEQVDKLVNAFHAVPNLIAIFTPLASVLSLALAARAGLSGLAKLGLMAGPAMGAGAMGKMRGGGRVGMAALAIGATVYGANKLWQASQKKTKPKGVEGEEDEEDTEEDAAQRRADRKTQRDTQRKMGKAQKAERAIIDAAREKYEIEEKTEGTLAYSLKIYNGIQAQVKTVTTLSNKWAESSSSIAEKLKEIGQIGPSIIDAAKQSAEATKMTYIQQEELYQAAKKNLGVELSGLDPKQKAVRMSEIAVVNAQRLLSLQKSTEASVKSSTIEQETSADLYKRQRDLLSSQADYQEKLALGMAISYNARKKVWEATVAERHELEKAAVNIRQNATEQKVTLVKLHEGDADRFKSLREFGVTQSQINRMAEGHLDAFLEARAAIGDKDQDAINAQTVLTQKYAMMVDMQKRIVDLKGTELEQTMKIREGYMDVINEMTTGNDLVTKLIPNMTRGAMSILDVRRQMMGADFGGAMRVGFGSKQGFGAAGGAAMAPSYGPSGGLEGSLFNPAIMSHRQWLDMYHGNTGAGFLRDRDIGQSAVGMLGIPGGQGPQTRPFNIGLPPRMRGGLLKTYQDGGLAGKSVVDLTATGGKIPGTGGAGRDNSYLQIGKSFYGGELAIGGAGETVIKPDAIRKPENFSLVDRFNKMGNVGPVTSSIYNASKNAADNNGLVTRVEKGSYIVNAMQSKVPGAQDALASLNIGDPSKLQDLVMGYRGGMLRSFGKGGQLRMFLDEGDTSNVEKGVFAVNSAMSLYPFIKHFGSVLWRQRMAMKTGRIPLKSGLNLSPIQQFFLGMTANDLVNYGIDMAKDKEYNIFPDVDLNVVAKEVEAQNTKEGAEGVINRYLNQIKVKNAQNGVRGWSQADDLATKTILAAGVMSGAFVSGKPLFALGYGINAVRDTFKSHKDVGDAIGSIWGGTGKRAGEVDEEVTRKLLGRSWGKEQTRRDSDKAAKDAEKAAKEASRKKLEQEILDIYNRGKKIEEDNPHTLEIVDKDPAFRESVRKKFFEKAVKEHPDLSPEYQTKLSENLTMESIRKATSEKIAGVREDALRALDAEARGTKGIAGGEGGVGSKSGYEIYRDRAMRKLKKLGIPDTSDQNEVLEEIKAAIGPEYKARRHQRNLSSVAADANEAEASRRRGKDQRADAYEERVRARLRKENDLDGLKEYETWLSQRERGMQFQADVERARWEESRAGKSKLPVLGARAVSGYLTPRLAPEKFSERDIELQKRRGGKRQVELPQSLKVGVAPRFSERDVELQRKRGRKRMRLEGGELGTYHPVGGIGRTGLFGGREDEVFAKVRRDARAEPVYPKVSKIEETSEKDKARTEFIRSPEFMNSPNPGKALREFTASLRENESVLKKEMVEYSGKVRGEIYESDIARSRKQMLTSKQVAETDKRSRRVLERMAVSSIDLSKPMYGEKKGKEEVRGLKSMPLEDKDLLRRHIWQISSDKERRAIVNRFVAGEVGSKGSPEYAHYTESAEQRVNVPLAEEQKSLTGKKKASDRFDYNQNRDKIFEGNAILARRGEEEANKLAVQASNVGLSTFALDEARPRVIGEKKSYAPDFGASADKTMTGLPTIPVTRRGVEIFRKPFDLRADNLKTAAGISTRTTRREGVETFRKPFDLRADNVATGAGTLTRTVDRGYGVVGRGKQILEAERQKNQMMVERSRSREGGVPEINERRDVRRAVDAGIRDAARLGDPSVRQAADAGIRDAARLGDPSVRQAADVGVREAARVLPLPGDEEQIRRRTRMRFIGGEISAYGIGGTIGALSQPMISGQSSSGSTPSSASLYLTGGINVDRLYLGGSVVGQHLQSDRNSFMKELSLQVMGQ